MKFQSIDKNVHKIKGKTVFLRADFNIPLSDEGVGNDRKILATLPTIRFLQRYNCKIIIGTHLGRPKGRKVKKYSTKILADRLEKLLKNKNTKKSVVKHIDQITGENAQKEAKALQPREILFLENLRFDKGEKKNDALFAKKMAGLADIYVNDAFSVSHRKHASVSKLKKYLPSFAGLLLKREVEHFEYIRKPRKPMVTVMGGAKVATKEDLIKQLGKKSTNVLLGGILANVFLEAKGFETGKSKSNKENLLLAKKILRKYKKKIVLPIDVVVCNRKNGTGDIFVRDVNKIKKNEYIFDIGPETVRFYAKIIKKAKTLVWNGPMGWFEKEKFNQGTLSTARLMASNSTGKSFGVVGGGETVKALKQTKMEDHVDWVSTGGGAMLTHLSEKPMPGLKELNG